MACVAVVGDRRHAIAAVSRNRFEPVGTQAFAEKSALLRALAGLGREVVGSGDLRA